MCKRVYCSPTVARASNNQTKTVVIKDHKSYKKLHF